MKNWKKLLFVALASVPAGMTAANNDCNDCNNGCSVACNSGCCVDFDPHCAGGRQTNKAVFVDTGFGASGTYLHEVFFRNELMDAADDCWGAAFQAVIFGGRTTDKGSRGLGQRFGFGHKRCFTVASGADATPSTRDIDAQHFNISTNQEGGFQSSICLCPRQSVIGALLSWKQSICADDNGNTRWWFEVNAPIVHSKHTMGLSETITSAADAVASEGRGLSNTITANLEDGQPFVASVAAGFAEMRYGIIDNCVHDNTELANLEVKIGYNSLADSDCFKFGSYIGFVAPTTEKRTAVFAFEPIVGQEHWAIMWGSTFDMKMCEWENSCLSTHFAIDSRWWFQRNEKRTFDLLNKSWGRYQEMYANLEQAQAAQSDENSSFGTFGTTIMTRCVDVTPGYQIDFNTGLMWKGCKFMVEVGHTFYARQAEEICPNWYAAGELPALKAAVGSGETNPVRTIGRRFPAEDVALVNYANSVINRCDVDWNAGAHEAILAHSLYGAVGYEFDCGCYPTFLALGGSWDFGIEDKGTSIMDRWNIFGKLGVSF